MPESASAPKCDCPDEHFATDDGRCDNAPLWCDDPEALDHDRYSWCGCCMADCPDVHLEPEPRRVVPGSLVVAEEYFDTLPEEKQRELREAEARGELRIAPRSEMGIPPDRVRILPSAMKHLDEYGDPDDELR
ncbi:hypothetical protein NLB33_04225 [Mycolicibacterium smegmatis]|uniref:hypothetical protein n=1 Tax=Mycolicibacterium smegmatis TaxID=1772 RepID=UPI0020A435C5|nr:hypothetical protein [Mycolicibacterium smegmatis]MCP2622059.1 hypothetical protein [Mycolicibacterium smegmatis]